jgi:hypothetical protein
MALETKLETTLTPGLDKQTLGKTNIATESNRSQTQTLPIPKENPFSFPTNKLSHPTNKIFDSEKQKRAGKTSPHFRTTCEYSICQ